MKKILFCIVFLFFSSLAIASDEVAKETIFVNSTTAERWSDFKKLLDTHNGISVLGDLRTVVLAEVAYEYAKGEDFPIGKIPFDTFKTLFQKQNHLGEIIGEDQFLSLAREGKFFLPKIEESASTTSMRPEDAALLKAQASTISELEKKVEDLSLVVAKNSTWQKNWEGKIGSFLNRFNLLQKDVDTLNQRQSNFIQTQVAEFKKLADKLTNNVNSSLTGLSKTINDLETKPKQSEDGKIVLSTEIKKWLVIAAAIAVVLLLLLFWFFASKFKDVKENKVSITAFNEVKDSVSATRSDLNNIGEIVTDLQEEMESKKGVTLAENFRVRLKELRQAGDEFNTLITNQDKSFVVNVRFSHMEDNGNCYVTLTGVRDQTRPVSVKNVASVLYRAANHDRLLDEYNSLSVVAS